MFKEQHLHKHHYTAAFLHLFVSLERINEFSFYATEIQETDLTTSRCFFKTLCFILLLNWIRKWNNGLRIFVWRLTSDPLFSFHNVPLCISLVELDLANTRGICRSKLLVHLWLYCRLWETMCDCRSETGLHVGTLGETGGGKEPIFILYLRRLGRTKTMIWIR